MKLTIDFETRSCVSLKDCGPWVYAEDPTTEVMCLALKEDNKPPVLWLDHHLFEVAQERYYEDNPGGYLWEELPIANLYDVQRLLSDADIIEAHNFEFERAMWQMNFGPKNDLPMLPLDKCRCSLAKASYHGLPRGLGDLCKALGVAVQKDDVGAKVMMKMCRPKRLVKAEWEAFAKTCGYKWTELKAMQVDLYQTIALGWHHVDKWSKRWGIPAEPVEGSLSAGSFIDWYEDPQDIVTLCRYCMTDVEAEHHASEALPDLPERELRVWQMDQQINARGLATDQRTAKAMMELVEQHTADLLDELETITNGEVQTPKQTQRFKNHVNALLPEEHQLGDLRAESVKAALKNEAIQGEARRLLEIRKSLALSSVAKYEAIINRASRDGRVRSSILYHGAGTGRFSGRGIQPHNFPRGKFSDTGACIDLINEGRADLARVLWGDPLAIASTCLRGVLVAPEGKEFTCSDYSNIEGRVVAWLAGEEWKVQSFRDYDTIVGFDAKGKPIRKGEDNYKMAYSRAFDVDVKAVTKDMRQIGKVMELACGFQGGMGAFQTMAGTYGVRVPDEQAQELVKLWREAHPNVVALWYGLEEAALMAVGHPGKAYKYRDTAYKMSRDGRFLLCRLPSGRLLHYAFPELREEQMPWGAKKTVVTYMATDSQTGKFVKSKGYGGLFTENCFTADTKVVTDSGIKPISEVLPSDRVWDGLEWVCHDGVAMQGRKEVIKWQGIRVTPEHRILVGNMWISVTDLDDRAEQEALKLGRCLAPSQLSRFLAEGTTERPYADVPAVENTRQKPELSSGEKPEPARIVPTESAGTPCNCSPICSQIGTLRKCGCGGTPAFYQGATLQAAPRTQTTAGEGLRCTSRGEWIEENSSFTQKPCRDGMNTASILTGLTTTETTNPETSELLTEKSTPETDEKPRSSSTKENDCPSWSSGKRIAQNGEATTPSSTTCKKGGAETKLPKYTGLEEVYDLVNCGPRNRFMILADAGPVIVHNCVQALSRDVMVEGMFRVEEAGYPVVLTVHDEVLSEHEVGFGSVDEFSTLLSVNPPWADGLPIAAAGWRGTRYRKD